MKNKILLSISVFAIVLLASCAKMPQVEIDNANLAVTAAQEAGADLYVPEAFNALKDSMNGAMESIEAQKSKLFKSYKTSKAQLLVVSQLGVEVKASAEAKIAELKAAIQNTLAEITAINVENKALVEKAPKGKGGLSALMAIKGEIANIDTTFEAISATAETENFNTTLNKALALKEQTVSINTELKTVIEKFQSKGK